MAHDELIGRRQPANERLLHADSTRSMSLRIIIANTYSKMMDGLKLKYVLSDMSTSRNPHFNTCCILYIDRKYITPRRAGDGTKTT
jgi:hypothetical protein